ncbi:reprolysin-like metallopeptidase [Halovulum sp. GXIMD14794]
MTASKKNRATDVKGPNPLRFRYKKDLAEAEEPLVHIYHHGAVCETETRGHAEPGGRSPLELVVDATEGFIPLWGAGVTLRWRFRPTSMALFRDPEAAKAVLRTWFGEGLLLWGDAVPVRFQEAEENWDFEIAVSPQANCSPVGCTLARAFFPDAGQHDLMLYPTLFEQTEDEIVETMAHELGHVFGLRHFFAQITEERWRSEIFGEHSPFSIMNYGEDSRMTDADRADLKTLYHMVWSGQLADINGTPVRQMRPFSEAGRCDPSVAPVAIAARAATVMA